MDMWRYHPRLPPAWGSTFYRAYLPRLAGHYYHWTPLYRIKTFAVNVAALVVVRTLHTPFRSAG